MAPTSSAVRALPMRVKTRTPLGWPGSGIDAVVCATVALLCILVVPSMLVGAVQPKRAVLLAAFPFGVALAGKLLRRRDVATIAGIGFVLGALISSLASPATMTALLGVVNRDQSVLLFACGLSVWAAARFMSLAGRALLAWTVVLVVVANGVVAVAQLRFQPQGMLELYLGRPTGLVGSPVVLGALAAPAVVWLAIQAVDRGDLTCALAAGGLYFVAALSGSRAAMAVSAMGIGWAIVRCRHRPMLAGALAASTVLGHIAAVLTFRVTDSAHDLATQAATVGGLSDRFVVWEYALRTWWQHPFTGVGPGRFHIGAQGFVTDEWVVRFNGDGWKDAHNVLLQMLATLGLPAAIAFVAFGVICARKARGPLAWMALACSSTWLLQPANHVLLPVAAAMLGSSMELPPAMLGTHLGKRFWAGCTIVGLFLAASFVVGDRAVDGVLRRSEAPGLSGSAVWFRWDPEVADAIASIVATNSSGGPSSNDAALAVAWSERAARSEPDSATWWSSVAFHRLRAQDHVGAELAIARALELRPNDAPSLQLAYQLAIVRGDVDGAREAIARLCTVAGDSNCDADEIIRQAGE